ncbi:MAG: hypothetical protein U0R24_08780 [Solirubrobacterales bacterium]
MKVAAIVVIALALGAAAVPVAGAAKQISEETTCKDLAQAGTEPLPGDNCLAASTQRRAVMAGLLGLSAVAAVAAMIAGGVAAVRGGRAAGVATMVLLALLAVALFFGAYAAARV